MTRFEGEEVHDKDNGIKVGPDGQFIIIPMDGPPWAIMTIYRL